MQLEGEVGHFTHGKELPACDFLLCSWCRERQTTSASSTSRNRLIDASRLSLEAQMECYFMLLEGKVGHFKHGKKPPACNFDLRSWWRGRQGTSPSFESKNGSINASKMSLEAQMKRDFMLLEGEVGHFAYGKKIPICQSLIAYK